MSGWYGWNDLQAQLNRIERKIDRDISAGGQELAVLQAGIASLGELIQQGGSNPAEIANLQNLQTKLKASADALAAALVANKPPAGTRQLATMETPMSALDDAITALGVQAQANVDAESSAVTLIGALAALIVQNATDPAVVTELGTKLKASADALGAAIVAGTPQQAAVKRK